jgi:hypothetical protein
VLGHGLGDVEPLEVGLAGDEPAVPAHTNIVAVDTGLRPQQDAPDESGEHPNQQITYMTLPDGPIKTDCM